MESKWDGEKMIKTCSKDETEFRKYGMDNDVQDEYEYENWEVEMQERKIRLAKMFGFIVVVLLTIIALK